VAKGDGHVNCRRESYIRKRTHRNIPNVIALAMATGQSNVVLTSIMLSIFKQAILMLYVVVQSRTDGVLPRYSSLFYCGNVPSLGRRGFNT
jgi:hypothetical protein